jgi:phosphopentomutase
MKCPQVKALHIPSSYKRTISNSAKMYLKMQGIELLEGDVWGHRKDINEYSEVSQSVYDRIKQYRLDGMQEDDIADKMVRETRLSPDFISFLIKSN